MSRRKRRFCAGYSGTSGVTALLRPTVHEAIRMLLSVLLHLPFVKTDAFEIEYASFTELKVLPTRAEIQLLNFTPWRDLLP